MVEHNSRANCNKSFTSDGELLLVAGVPIKAGSHLSVCYTDPMWGTEGRRHHLADTWFFECHCERCSDVTEFGTNYSAVKCKKKDCKGYLLPPTFIVPILQKTLSPDPSTRSLDDKLWRCARCRDQVSDAVIQQLLQDIGRELSVMPKGDADASEFILHKTLSPEPASRSLDDKLWRCARCRDQVSDAGIQQLLQDIGRELSGMPKGDAEACEKFISHCSSYLYPSHYYITDVGLALAQMIGQDSELGLAGVMPDRLALKTQLCRKIADLMETLAPAETRSRGSVLFELHAAVAETGRREAMTDGPAVLLGYVTTRSRGSVLFELHAAVAETGRREAMTGGPAVLLGYVTESRKILQQAACLLRHEPPELPEGRVLRQAKENLLQMDQLIQNLSNALPSPM
ncbi:unnamed protein product [Plutella xylostella]|uniref:(diamondback moth) hypothetical protein n=1 Tax=Plutella xylostella TaxID=51655 RepID=A0A8S4FLW9_PLUXY|nr:unnamed protein product [Plutella xylostella]